MASLVDAIELELLDHVLGTGSWTSPAQVYIKLHIGDPGETGTANAAAETTRPAANWNAASGGQATLAATVSWTSVSTTETYSHYSLWDANTAGNVLLKGALDSSVAVTAGDNFDLTALTISAD
jgi:hypothetical protein